VAKKTKFQHVLLDAWYFHLPGHPVGLLSRCKMYPRRSVKSVMCRRGGSRWNTLIFYSLPPSCWKKDASIIVIQSRDYIENLIPLSIHLSTFRDYPVHSTYTRYPSDSIHHTNMGGPNRKLQCRSRKPWRRLALIHQTVLTHSSRGRQIWFLHVLPRRHDAEIW
jgi:hypothetical protein